jgi:hypothetical protein
VTDRFDGVKRLLRDEDAVADRARHVAARARFVEAATATRPQRVRPLALVSVTVFCAAIAASAAVLVGGRATNVAPVASASVPSASTSEPTRISLPDGSTIVLAQGARGHVRDVTADGATLVLDEGTATVDVIHRPGVSWSVIAGPYRVWVTGTTFDVAWKAEPAQLRVAMKTGTVRVTGPELGDGQPVGVGEPITFSPTSAPPTAPPESVSGRETSARPPPREAHREPPWTELVDHGEHELVLKKAEAMGVADVLATRGEADLMALADAARFSGRKPLARDALLAVRRRFPGGGRAATATFLLGKLDDEAGRPSDAAGWYERYLDEARSGPLVMEASARAIAAWKRAGDTPRARAAAESYLRRFPDGPSASAAREILDR